MMTENNNEVMELEVMEYEEVVEPERRNGVGLGMLIGTLVVGAGVGLYKLGKKAWNSHKANKEATVVYDPDVKTTEKDVEEVVEAEVVNETKSKKK